MILQREHETLMFVGCVTVIKNRGAPTWLHYLKKFMTYAKMANIYLFYRQHPLYGVIYVLLCIGENFLETCLYATSID